MNTQPRMLKQKDLRRLMKVRLLNKTQEKAAIKIQAAWRRWAWIRYQEQRALEQEQYEDYNFGCDCGDWLCTGCGKGPPIPCVMCGADCRGSDYEKWSLCSRRCMVRECRD